MNPGDTERQQWIADMRDLLDVLEANPELPLPTVGRHTFSPVNLGFFDTKRKDDRRAQLARAVRALRGGFTKDYSGNVMKLDGTFGSLHLRLMVPREQVCERRVLGVRPQTVEIPDPAAAVPKKKVTYDAEVVEWSCPPLLAATESEAVSA
ncbi:hypothetical protein [Actinoallomurus vinaceus]